MPSLDLVQPPALRSMSTEADLRPLLSATQAGHSVSTPRIQSLPPLTPAASEQPFQPHQSARRAATVEPRLQPRCHHCPAARPVEAIIAR